MNFLPRLESRCTTSPEAGFTFLELLVLLGVLALLGLTLLPALAGSRSGSPSIQCLNNTRQLTTAWRMYADDFDDRCIANAKPVSGAMDWTASPDNTNSALLTDPNTSPLAPYVTSVALWKCPADKYQSSANPGPRIRSVSLNGALGGKPAFYNELPGRTYFSAQKLSDLNIPGPAQVFVLIEEHPDSINDSVFMPNAGLLSPNASWRDLPASYHNGAAVLSFADGRSEAHTWRDLRTTPPVLYVDLATFAVPGSVDYVWLDDRLPYR